MITTDRKLSVSSAFWLRLITALFVLLPLASYGQFCGELRNHFGPFDYTDPVNRIGAGDRNRLGVVETYHFTREIEALTRKNHLGELYASSLLAELSYTLRAFPNHHRALNALTRLNRLVGGKLPQLADYTWPTTLECYFRRALEFRPNDPIVRLLWAINLHASGNYSQALEEYKRAEQLHSDIPDLHYNMGLLYADLKQYDLAKQHAQKAYQLGHRQVGLLNRLKEVGYWP